MSDPLPPRPDLGWTPGEVDVPRRPDDAPTPSAPRVTWKWWEALLVGLMGFVLGGILGAILAAPFHGNHLRFVVIGLGSEAGLFATVLGWIRLVHPSSLGALRLNLRRPVDALVGAGCGFAIFVIAALALAPLLVALFHLISHHNAHTPRQLPQHLHGAEIALTVILVLVFAPIAEETFFRGFLFAGFRARYCFLLSAGASAALFGMAHYQPAPWQNWLLLCLLLAGVGFGLAFVYEWRKNLLANMAAHAAFNVVGVFLILGLLR